MDKKKKKPVRKKPANNQYHLITDLKNPNRDTQVVSFDDKEEIQEYLVDELEDVVGYDFEDGDDIIIYGELKKVTVTKKTFKVNIK